MTATSERIRHSICAYSYSDTIPFRHEIVLINPIYQNLSNQPIPARYTSLLFLPANPQKRYTKLHHPWMGTLCVRAELITTVVR